MTDIPGDTTTTTTISVGSTLTNSLEVIGDRDWIAVTLTAGQQVVISLSGTGTTPVDDTYLRLRDSSGNLITENDDSGGTYNSRIVFTAPSAGTYYIDVGAYDDDYAGTYELSVQPYVPPAVATYDTIGNQLTHGYWGGDWHQFDVVQGGSITVNLTALTADGRTMARAALALWSDVIGVTFSEVTTGGQITFDDDDEGAYASTAWSDHIISTSHVNVSTDWLVAYGTSLNSYAFQAYVHEVGHALGLGHAGNYDGTASYPDDALFANDSWLTSIMSYFSQTDNAYFRDQGFTYNFVVTPMNADIVAMQWLYGLSTTTRTGNTTYGFNSNAGRDVFNANLHPGVGYTIFDNGGIDTLDYSGFTAHQRIDLNSEAFSNVGGEVGNVMIARGTTIENAYGGSGNDTLIGNSSANLLAGNAGNDRLEGHGGADRLNGGSGDDILEGGAGIDAMRGGTGNDTYYVDNVSDKVIENSGEGIDIVYSSSSFSLRSNVENLVITGSAVRGNGNNLNNSITGNSSNNIINGGLGADTMTGGLGNDTYYVDNVGDSVIEAAGAGRDRIYTTISYTLGANQDDVFARGSSAINLTGNALDNVLRGNSAGNILDGGIGADDLKGGAGADTFLFDDGEFGGLGTSTCDRIIDFTRSDGDLIDLSAVDANSALAGDQAFAFIGTGAFTNVAGQLRYEQIGGNTYVFGDTNGDGIADFLLRLDGSHALVGGDFVI